ncbi:putative ORFan [Tupanvirus deep ocean]|uniref:ORFan n=2 Tax=Tupanvirus TaxID=2094720 RepID=A0AC62A8H8_9VIRU|nr:putative ORFan [Tupanvirus deep ocean]QKU34024.1 putative ORFan [Tupanvirus deep ocean]
MTKIIVFFPGNDCDEFNCATSQDVFIVEKQLWEDIIEYFSNGEYDISPWNCGCGYSIVDYIEACQIIEDNPSDDVINFATKIQNDLIVKYYHENKLLYDKKKLINIMDRIGHFKELSIMDKNMENLKLQKIHEKEKEKRAVDNKISCQTGRFII